MKKKIIALMPLKANSERVKGKNFKNLVNKPLFKWMLDTLTSVTEIDQIIINTDAKELLLNEGLIESNKVLLRERKASLCGDFTSMNLILEDDIADSDADIYLMTHVTNPFLSKETIKQAIHTFTEADALYDSLFSVNKLQSRFYLSDGSAVNHDPNNLIRTQDLAPYYEENSCLYLFSKQSFQNTHARIGNKPILFKTPALESIDIDEPEDWQLAEALAVNLDNKGLI